jgi:hypothetical protein
LVPARRRRFPAFSPIVAGFRSVQTWDAAAGEIVYSPSDPTTINGVFALGAAQPDRDTLARQMITSYYVGILGRPPKPAQWTRGTRAISSYGATHAIDVRFVAREMARIFFECGIPGARS